jgi:hypothetical protein
MRKARFAGVNDIRIDEDLNIGVLEIEGKEYVILGGEFTASGVMNYLRPYEKVKENWDNLEKYSRSRRDAVLYMDNRAVLKCQEYERQLRHDLESQKW